ncbi:Metallo-dependent hydrolase [Coprinellus micaceus]|uniref:Metallo-dependent hydrolase n=1 Tax=Coprinellus micaceus TaxID=71717 RepID=A0A4Y7SY28_COPMI|nr:Metallo-dependent hydrolase [Coprinellus micaceus]
MTTTSSRFAGAFLRRYVCEHVPTIRSGARSLVSSHKSLPQAQKSLNLCKSHRDPISAPRSRICRISNTPRSYCTYPPNKSRKMGKKNKGPSTPPSSSLILPAPPTSKPIVDTHTHLASTFKAYQDRYATRTADVNDLPTQGKTIETVYDFANVMYEGKAVEAIVDVWCEHTQIKSRLWKEYADAALDTPSKWGSMEYHFVIGIHPHEAKDYDDEVEAILAEAAAHPRCVGLGEMGLDYHYSLSPHDVQQAVLRRQLELAVKLNKPLTIHTREAEEGTERLLKEIVPKDHKIHIHCFTDSPEFAKRLLEWFPNLYIGVTGVVTYTTNANTAQVVRELVAEPESKLRIVLETDAPYMVPANIYDSVPAIKGKRFPVCHTAMVPWTAQFVANAITGPPPTEPAEDAATVDATEPNAWTADRVMVEARENARRLYGV